MLAAAQGSKVLQPQPATLMDYSPLAAEPGFPLA